MIDKKPSLQQDRPTIYLWLNCEGWVPFGPFGWLGYDTSSQSYVDSKGNTIAT